MLAEAKRECDRLIGEARGAGAARGIADRDREACRAPVPGHRRGGAAHARETRLEMEDWADGILSTLEVNLDKFLGAVRRGRERLHERYRRRSSPGSARSSATAARPRSTATSRRRGGALHPRRA